MNILNEANKIVGSRDGNYGDPVKSWQDIAAIVSTLRRKNIDAMDCITVLKIMKQVRESYQHKDDNLIDEAGYLLIEKRLHDAGGK